MALYGSGWRHVYVDGGKVIQSFLRAGLIADLVVTRIPILIGDGIPLFGSLTADITLKHNQTTAFDSGFVQTKYEVVPACDNQIVGSFG